MTVEAWVSFDALDVNANIVMKAAPEHAEQYVKGYQLRMLAGFVPTPIPTPTPNLHSQRAPGLLLRRGRITTRSLVLLSR